MTVRRALALALLTGLTSGCVYFNSIYNARQRFADGERARMEGRTEDARVAYDDVVRKAARSYRKEPDGAWADDALYILGRAYLRQGDFARAIGALTKALERADDDEVRLGAGLYLGAAFVEVGVYDRAAGLLDEAVAGLQGRSLLGEAHLWRARLLFAQGAVDQARFDLVRAEAVDPGLHVAVLFEQLAHGIAADDQGLAGVAANGLLADSRAGSLVDSIASLVRRAEVRWDPGAAASLLAGARTGDWPPGPRDQLLMQRIDLLARAGDTLAVESEAGWASRGTTPGAEAARLVVASIRLRRTVEVEALDEVRTILLPAGGNPQVAALAADIRRVELLDEWGATDDPVAWFVAAEMARDRLGSPRLARGLFLRFASEAPASPWAGKAVLAALATTPDPRSDPALRAGLEARRTDPYVAGVRSGVPIDARLGELEARLNEIMEGLLARADAEAQRRDLFLRGVDTFPVVPAGGGGG